MPRKKMTKGQKSSLEARKKLLEYRPMVPTGKFDPKTGKPLMERKGYYYDRDPDPKKQAANKACAVAAHQSYLRTLALASSKLPEEPSEEAPKEIRKGTVDWYLLRIAKLNVGKARSTRDGIQFSSNHLSRIAGGEMVKDIKAPEIAQIVALVPGSAATKNKVRNLVYQVNELAAEEDKEVTLVSRKWVKPQKQRAPKLVVQTPRESMAVALSVPTQYRIGALFQATFGVRAGESSAPLWMDLTPLGTLSLVRQDDEEEGWKEELKNEDSVRELPLPSGLIEILQAHRDEERRKGRGRPSDPICATSTGTAVMENNLRRAVRGARLRLGMADYPGRPCHIFRHSLATWLDNSGCPEGVRLAILGQSRAAVKDRYVHAGPADMLPWIEKWWQEASGAAPAPLERKGGPKAPATGARNGRSRLNHENHRLIKEMLGKESDAEIARRAKVDPKTVRNVRDGLDWISRKSTCDVVAATT